MVALPEVVLTSYIADDMLCHDIVLGAAEETLAHLVAETAKLDVVFSVGLPLCVNGKIYNTLAICHAGEIMGVVPKTYIPTYGVDFEGRWFSSGPADVTYITVAGQELLDGLGAVLGDRHVDLDGLGGDGGTAGCDPLPLSGVPLMEAQSVGEKELYPLLSGEVRPHGGSGPSTISPMFLPSREFAW